MRRRKQRDYNRRKSMSDAQMGLRDAGELRNGGKSGYANDIQRELHKYTIDVAAGTSTFAPPSGNRMNIFALCCFSLDDCIRRKNMRSFS